MIRSFRVLETERVWRRERSREYPDDIQLGAVRRLTMLDAATSLHDLAAVRGNRLHPLKDDRAGQHSISINDQWRICFVWKDGDAYDVEITDYH